MESNSPSSSPRDDNSAQRLTSTHDSNESESRDHSDETNPNPLILHNYDSDSSTDDCSGDSDDSSDEFFNNLRPPTAEWEQLQSGKARVQEVFEHGSFFEAIDCNYITIKQCLFWLKDQPISDEVLTVYRIMCLLQRPENHMLAGIHFLVHRQEPEFGAIYLMSGGDSKAWSYEMTYENYSKFGDITIGHFLTAAKTKLATDYDFRIQTQVYCDKLKGLHGITQMQLPIIVKGRSTRILQVLLNDISYINSALDYFLESDQIECLKSYTIKDAEKKILKRCRHLQSQAPNYWEHVSKKLYRKLIQDCSLTDPVSGISRDCFLGLAEIFPEIYPEDVMKFSPLAYKVAGFPYLTQVYFLGLPLEQADIDQAQRIAALTELSKLGKDQYCQVMNQRNLDAIQNLSDFTFPMDWNLRIGNTTDLMMEDISGYNMFDVVKLAKGDHVYFFTRSEFEDLRQNKKNPYTKDHLPVAFIYMLAEKCVIAEQFLFPPAEPLIDMLSKIENGRITPCSLKETPCSDCGVIHPSDNDINAPRRVMPASNREYLNRAVQSTSIPPSNPRPRNPPAISRNASTTSRNASTSVHPSRRAANIPTAAQIGRTQGDRRRSNPTSRIEVDSSSDLGELQDWNDVPIGTIVFQEDDNGTMVPYQVVEIDNDAVFGSPGATVSGATVSGATVSGATVSERSNRPNARRRPRPSVQSNTRNQRVRYDNSGSNVGNEETLAFLLRKALNANPATNLRNDELQTFSLIFPELYPNPSNNSSTNHDNPSNNPP